MSSNLKRRLSAWFQSSRKVGKRQPARYPLRLEPLEDRLAPATHVWTGGALSNNVTNDNNWNIGAPNSPDDVLVFPVSAQSRVVDNNFAAGITFNSLIFQGSGYTLRGNRLNLGAGGINASGSGAISNEIRLDLSLGATRTITVGTSDRLEITGDIIGNGGLTKEGTGTLTLVSNTNSYAGLTTVGNGVLEAERPGSLGSTASGTRVEGLSELRILGPTVGDLDLNEPLILDGSSRLKSEGRVNIHSSVQLTGPSVRIDGRSGIGHQLTISGAMSGAGGWELVGEAHLEGTSANTYAGLTQVGDGVLGGKLFLNKPNAVAAIPGDLTIGDTPTNAQESSVVLRSHSQIDDDSRVLIRRHGALDMNGFGEAIGDLELQSGRVESTFLGIDYSLLVNGSVFATSLDPSSAAVISVPVFLGTELRTFDIADGPAYTDLFISGQIFGSGGIIKKGEGGLILGFNNTYTGLTIVDAGILQVDGSQPNSGVILNGGTLAGGGTIGSLTVEAGARVSPGDPFDVTDVLRVRGDALFNPGSIFEVDLDGTLAGSGHDQLDVRQRDLFTNSTTIIDGAILVPVVGPNSVPGRTFRIIDTDGFPGGAFEGFPEGSIFTTASGVRLSINYLAGFSFGNVTVTHENTATKVEDLAVTPEAIDEGGEVTVTGHLTDPDQLDKLTLQIDWGDDSRMHTSHPGVDPFAVGHRYRDDGTYVIHVVWFDEHGEGNSRDLTVTVDNVDPEVFAGGTVTLNHNGNLVRHGFFLDPGLDSWTGTVDYGDGTGAETLTVHKNRFKLHHRYQAAGTYEVTVTIHDDDGGTGTASFQVTVEDKPGKGHDKGVDLQQIALDALFASLVPRKDRNDHGST